MDYKEKLKRKLQGDKCANCYYSWQCKICPEDGSGPEIYSDDNYCHEFKTTAEFVKFYEDAVYRLRS